MAKDKKVAIVQHTATSNRIADIRAEKTEAACIAAGVNVKEAIVQRIGMFIKNGDSDSLRLAYSAIKKVNSKAKWRDNLQQLAGALMSEKGTERHEFLKRIMGPVRASKAASLERVIAWVNRANLQLGKGVHVDAVLRDMPEALRAGGIKKSAATEQKEAAAAEAAALKAQIEALQQMLADANIPVPEASAPQYAHVLMNAGSARV